MSIPLRARLVDVTNLLISKGSNFLMTILLFSILSRGIDAHGFAELGYWWSVGVMIGGVMMGGLGATVVRITTTYGSLTHLTPPLVRIGLVFALLSLLLWVALANDFYTGPVLIACAVALFGVSMLAQTAVLGLLRAVEATQANIKASVLVLALVPGLVWVFADPQRELSHAFMLLAMAFAVGTVGAFVCGRASLAPLFMSTATVKSNTPPSFLHHALAFTATNIFSYAVMNADFTIFRIIGAPDDFATMATGKVFFERFAIPALAVFVGAISLRVLRHPNVPGAPQARIELKLNPFAVLIVLVLVTLLIFGYWIFAHLIRGDMRAIGLPWVACAAVGYILYSFNSILLDLLVVRRSVGAVVTIVVGFILIAGAIQIVTIYLFGVPGWAVGWLVFNLVVTFLFWRSDLFTMSSQLSIARN